MLELSARKSYPRQPPQLDSSFLQHKVASTTFMNVLGSITRCEDHILCRLLS